MPTTSNSWTNTSGGLWGGAGNWSGGVPTSSSAVTISAAGTYTVTIAAATQAAAASVLINDAGATLDDLGTLTIGSGLTVTAGTFILDNGGTLQGGVVAVGASGHFLNQGGTLSGVTYQGTLDLSETAAAVTLAGVTTLQGTGGTGAATVNLTGAGAQLYQSGSGTLNNATLNIGNATTADTLSVLDVAGAGILTLGSTLSTKFTTGNATLQDAGGGGDGIVNRGTITAAATVKTSTLTIAGNSFTNANQLAVSGGVVNITDSNFINSGTLAVSGGTGKGALTGTVSIGGTASSNSGLMSISAGVEHINSTVFTNSGSFAVSGGTLEFGGTALSETTVQADSWSSSGVISETGGTLDLNGAFSTASLNTITDTKGKINIFGTLNNEGQTLNVGTGSALGTITFGTFTTATVNGETVYSTYGYIVGGTIHDAGGGLLMNYGTLDGVIYQGTVSVTGSDTDLTITDGITLENLAGNGPGAMLIGSSKYNTYVETYGSTTLNNATITMGSNNTTATSHGTTTVTHVGSYLYTADTGAAATLTLGSGLIVTETSVAHLVAIFADDSYAGDAIINNGQMIANASAGDMDVTANTVTNNGLMALSNGGTLEIDTYNQFINTGSITNAGGTLLIDVNATGPIVAAGGTVVTESLTNSGTIISTGGEVEFCGTLTAGWDTHFSATGGQTYLQAYTYAIDGGTTLTAGNGSAGVANLLVLGGTIIGGAVQDLGGGLDAAGGTLDGVTYEGNFDPLAHAASAIDPTTGQAYYPGLNAHYIELENATVFTGANGTGPGTLTLTNGISVFAMGNEVIDNAGISIGAATAGGVVLGEDASYHGTFALGVNAVLTEVGANVTLQSGTGASDMFVNMGTVNAAAGGTVTLTGNEFYNSGTLAIGSGTVADAATALGNVGAITLAGGTLDANGFTNGAGGTVAGFGLLDTVTAGGTLVNNGLITASGGTLVIGSALSGSGTLAIGAGATLVLDQAGAETNAISAAAGDVLDLAGIAGATAQLSGGILTVSLAGGGTDSFVMPGSAGLTVGTSSDGAGGTDLTFFNLATASLATTTVNFGNVHVGDVVSAGLSVTNGAAAGLFSEALDAMLGGATGGATGSGSFSGLAGGATDGSDLMVGLNTSSDGVVSGTVSVSLASDGSGIDGNGTTTLNSDVVNVTGTVWAYAAPTISTTTLELGAVRVGGTLAGGFSLGNGVVADAYQESLLYALTGLAGGSGSGTIVSGGGVVIGVSYDTSVSGYINDSGMLGLTSTGAGTSGLADTFLGDYGISVTGAIYQTAEASISTTNISFGVVHVGDALTEQLIVGNIASGALVDDLLAMLSGDGGAFSGSGGLDLVAGANGTYTIGFDTGTAGIFDGSLDLSLVSHDGVLADLVLGDETITLTGTVDNYASLGFGASGSGAFGASGTLASLNFGTVVAGTAESESFSISNAAAGQADLLSGVISLSGSADGFTNTGLGSFTGLSAGQAFAGLDISFAGTLSGTYSETIVITATGYDADYSGAAGSETLTVTETIVGSTTLSAGVDTVAAGGGTDYIYAAAGALSKGDSINGGAGVNTLVLTGAGAFNLAAPTTLTNISAVDATEIAGGGEQTVTLRAGLTTVVNVASVAGGSITIIGANNSDTINLGNGTDTVTVGSFDEVINGGSGTDIFIVNASTIKAAIHGGSGTNLLDVTGGGTVKMGTNLTGHFASVDLSGTGYVFTADTQAGLAILAGAGSDMITVGAASQSVSGAGAGTVVHVDASTLNAGVLISNVSSASVLEITNGGTATLNGGDTGLTVDLDKAAHLNLGGLGFITAVGEASGAIITAGGANQTLSSAVGGDSLIGYTGFGDNFSGTLAGMSGDKITNFGGSDVLHLTNLASVTGETMVSHANNTVLTLSGAAGSTTITFLGAYTASDFVITSSGGSTAVSYTGH